MGVEVFTNKKDTEAVLVCNTECVPIPKFMICDSDSYEDTASDDHYVPASAMAEAFLKWCREMFVYSDPRQVSTWELKDRFTLFRKHTKMETI